MLHELLLALSGHASPLFAQGSNRKEDLPLLSPSERALLDTLGRLSLLNRQLQHHAEWLVANHPSTICRAVANALRNTHLARFQRKILDVEGRILTTDAGLVGAYNIVPLSSIAAEFDDWHRRMEWYWSLATFMHPEHHSVVPQVSSTSCSGATLIDWLVAETQTGFPDIELAATELCEVAELAWLRQLASWVVYGKLLDLGKADFFVQIDGSPSDDQSIKFRKDYKLLPKFVSSTTANSILFIGKSLYQVRHVAQTSGSSASTRLVDAELASTHLRQLTGLPIPLNTAQLSRAISSIRTSLATNILHHLLPLETTLRLLGCLRQYFLLENGEFAVALMSQAESRLQSRWQSMGRLLQLDPVKALRGLSIKDGELGQTLMETWKTLSRSGADDTDMVLDFAQRHVTLAAPRTSRSRPSTSDSTSSNAPGISAVAFNDLLFPSPTVLEMAVPSPLDLFISQKDIEIYSSVNAYLFAIRRAHIRLADLWRRSPARRHHPAPPGPKFSNNDSSRDRLDNIRSRRTRRMARARKVWASCSAAVFLLAETSAYLEGEVIRESWTSFVAWVQSPSPGEQALNANLTNPSNNEAQRDPESLASGHRVYLASLAHDLLLTDEQYTRELRSLIGNVDNLIAFFNKLLDVQQKLDVEHGSGGESNLTKEDERRIALELDRARKKVDSDLKSVVNRLRQLDHERIGSKRHLDLGRAAEAEAFEPWQGGGVDRLLMKLQFGSVAVEDFDLV